MCNSRLICVILASVPANSTTRDVISVLFLGGLVISLVGLFAAAQVSVREQKRELLRRIVGTAIFILLLGAMGGIAGAVQSDFPAFQNLGIVGILIGGALGTLLQSWGGFAAEAIVAMPHRRLRALGSWLVVVGVACEVAQVVVILAGQFVGG